MALFGLLCYDNSYNLGDCVQSIAARAFLPRVDLHIDRDTGKTDVIPTSRVALIANGWYDGNYCKFPFLDNIDPLLISFHVNEVDHSSDIRYEAIEKCKLQDVKSIASNVAYLRKHEPVGCRDLHTLRLLEKAGVRAYFSGCLTLTLKRTVSEPRTEDILVVDAHIQCPDLYKRLVPESVRAKAVCVSQAINTLVPHAEKMKLAEQHLQRLQTAKLVITSRLHTLLPCLAYKTPVIFLFDDMNDVRFGGLLDGVPTLTNESAPIDFDHFVMPELPRIELIANNLRSTVSQWIAKKQPFCQSYCKNFATNELYLNPAEDSFEGLRGCSIVAATMNREHHIAKSLPSWLQAQPDEIVLLDWGSTNYAQVESLVADHDKQNKVKLIRITNVDRWNLTRALNLAARFTRYQNILKLDADTLLDPHFFQYHNIDRGSFFYTGDWKRARNENERHTNGILFVRRVDFFGVGGYNELITTYGYDDCDLYKRLERRAQRLVLDLNRVSHICHAAADRYAYQNLGMEFRLDVEIERNRLLSEMTVWKGPLSNFAIKERTNRENWFEGQFVSAGAEVESRIRDLALETAMKNRQWARAITPRTRRFYMIVQNGLGNRLRALASAYNIAKRSRRQLFIVWKPDEHCQADFTDLFKWNFVFKGFCNLIQDVEQTDRGTADQKHLTVVCEQTSCAVMSGAITYDYAARKNEMIDANGTDQDIYVYSACALNSPLTNWAQECAFLRNLEPVDDIADEIEEFTAAHHVEEMIGVHIRMGQSQTAYKYEDTSAYSVESKTSIDKWRNASHWTTFAKHMETLPPDQRFLVCADNEEARMSLKRLFGPRVVCTERKHWDRSVQQIKSAVIDMLLLAKTKHILGSNWSSFSEVVHRIGGNALKLAGVDF